MKQMRKKLNKLYFLFKLNLVPSYSSIVNIAFYIDREHLKYWLMITDDFNYIRRAMADAMSNSINHVWLML